MLKKKLVLVGSIFAFITAFSVESYGFNIGNFGKILENVTEGAKSSNKPGAASSPSNGTSGSNSKSGDLDYSSGSIVNFLCRREADSGEWTPDVPKNALMAAVAEDFGKSPENTQGTLYRNSTNGIEWAQKFDFYRDGFNAVEIKRLYDNFVRDGLRRLEIAGKIKHAISHDDLEEPEQNDARFAYALILAHFDAQHKKRDMMERYLKTAWNDQSTGAMYVRGSRMYLGQSYPKDVNGAKNFIFLAYNKINEIVAAAEEAGEAPPDVWEEPEKLWITFATDPEFEGHRRFQSLKSQADQIQKSLQKEMDKGAGGSALASNIRRLNKIRAGAEVTLARAFGVGQKLAVMNKDLIDLKNRANPNAQVIAKTVAMEDNTTEKLTEIIGKQTTKLSPEGMKLASEAQMGATYVATEAFSLIFGSYMSNPGAGGIGGAVAVLKSAGHTKNLACKLNTAIVDYTKRTKVTLDKTPPAKGSLDKLENLNFGPKT